ncbi:DUF456 domain-containing protein [Bacillus sp. 179-C3.3 HS]|uniref:DUF456 domain-containing protein n=1 Tax=Bacillus sp. 179-C3.3 HS TaxID=3232162 RepID=UPI0039A1BB83
MDVLYWILIGCAFVVAFVGLIYPIIPSVVFMLLGFILYGVFFSFEPLTFTFWLIQVMLTVVLFVADYVSNLIGVKRFGGSRAAIWGSTIGLLIGPFVIPIAGIILGPFIGSVLAELLVHRKDVKTSIKVGVGSLIGFVSGVFAKGFIQTLMLGIFLFYVLR